MLNNLLFRWILRRGPSTTTLKAPKLRVNQDGKLYTAIGRADSIHCDMDLEFFPRDTQVCTFSCGSWSYDSKDLRTIAYGDTTEKYEKARPQNDTARFLPGIDLQNFRQRDTHTIRQISLKPRVSQYSSSPDPWTQLDYTFVIVREAYTYTSIVSWPLVIVTSVAV